MPDTKHGAATVTMPGQEGKIYRAGRDYYLAARGVLVMRGSNIKRWAEEHDYSRQGVEDALYGQSNSPTAKSIRAEIAADLGLAFEESAAA